MAMGESWLIYVAMRFASNGARVMNEMAGATGRANALVDAHTGKIKNATAALEAYRLKALQLGTTVAGGFAIAGAALSVAGIAMAAKMQTAMVGLNIRTMNQAPQGMRAMVEQVANMTAQSQITIAQEAQVLASTIHDPNQLRQRFPVFAKAADVAMLSTGADPVETTKQLNFFSHMFGVFKGNQLNDMVNSAIKLLAVQPEGLPIMTRQMKYFVGIATAAGVPMDQLFQILMSAGQLGLLRGRSGSGIGMAVTRSDIGYDEGGVMPKNLRRGLEALHAYDASGHVRWIHTDAAGKQTFDFNQMMSWMAKRYNEMPHSEFVAAVKGFADASAAQILTIMSRPSARAQQQRNIAAFAHIPSVDEQYQMYINTLAGRWRQFFTNVVGVMIDLFTPLLPALTKIFDVLQQLFAGLGGMLRANPGLAAALSTLIVSLTGLAAIRWGFGTLTGLFKLPLTLGLMGRSMDALAATAVRDAIEIRAAAAGAGIPIYGRGGGAAVMAEREGRAAEGIGMKIARFLGTGLVAITGLNLYTISAIIGLAPQVLFFWNAFKMSKQGMGEWHKIVHQYDYHTPGRHAAIMAGYVTDVKKIKSGHGGSLLQPHLLQGLGLPSSPQHAFMTSWSPAQMKAFKDGFEHGATQIKTAAQKMNEPMSVDVKLDVSLPPGMTINNAEALIAKAGVKLRSFVRSNPSKVQKGVPRPLQYLEPFLSQGPG